MCIVSLETVMSVKAIELHDSFSDGTVRVDKLNVILLIEKVVFYLRYPKITLVNCSSSDCRSASPDSAFSGRMESAKLTLLRLFSELDLTTVSLGGDSTLLSLGIVSA